MLTAGLAIFQSNANVAYPIHEHVFSPNSMKCLKYIISACSVLSFLENLMEQIENFCFDDKLQRMKLCNYRGTEEKVRDREKKTRKYD